LTRVGAGRSIPFVESGAPRVADSGGLIWERCVDYAITDATEADAVLLASLIRESFAGVAQRFGLTPENSPTHPSNCTPEWISSAFAKGVRYHLIRNDQGPAGCVALEQAAAGLCYLERLAVLPSYRRRGLGKALVDHVVTKAREVGARRVEIGIISADVELGRWYEKLGFSVTTTARFEHLPFEVTFMRKALVQAGEKGVPR
jgi:GNAT superfamily N-acetyltransferase